MHAYQTPKTPQGQHFAGTSPQKTLLYLLLFILPYCKGSIKHQNIKTPKMGEKEHACTQEQNPFPPAPPNKIILPHSACIVPTYQTSKTHSACTLQAYPLKSPQQKLWEPLLETPSSLWRCPRWERKHGAAIFAHGTFVIWFYPHHITGLYTSQLVQERNVTPWVLFLFPWGLKEILCHLGVKLDTSHCFWSPSSLYKVKRWPPRQGKHHGGEKNARIYGGAPRHELVHVM